MTLTDDEVGRLVLLPGAWDEVETVQRCDLGAGHRGRHTTCAQMQDADDGTVVYWWLWWDGEEHEIAAGPPCVACEPQQWCLRPDGHGGIHGIAGEPRETCCGVVAMTADEVEHFSGLPDAVHEVMEDYRCALDPGHAGWHGALVQSQDREVDTSAEWWVTWSPSGSGGCVPTTTGHEITVREPCPVVGKDLYDQETTCFHPTGHGGRHRFD